MPVTPTYPGVYIEEIPSGVRTITGVATSITAFVGYTPRGPVNKAVRILSFADYERNFGGLDRNSEISYAVQQFFLNGGTDAYIVRVAKNATTAQVSIQDTSGTVVLVAAASQAPPPTPVSPGVWGNNVRLDVDYATTNPDSTFNLSVTRFDLQNGQLVPAENERYLNLSLNSRSSNYVVNVVNSASKLIRLTRPGALTFAAASRGVSLSASLATFPALTAQDTTITGVLDGVDPFTLTLTNPTAINGAANKLDALVTAITAAINSAGLSTRLQAIRATAFGADDAAAGNFLKLTSLLVAANPNTVPEFSSVQITKAPSNDLAAKLKLGLVNGGREVEGAASRRPAQTGTIGASLADVVGTNVNGDINVVINDNSTGAPVAIFTGAAPTITLPATAVGPGLATTLQGLIRGIGNPATQQAVVQFNGTALRVLPSAATPNASIILTGAGATTTKLTGAGSLNNVQQYTLGTGATFGAQASATPGTDGIPPDDATLILGSNSAKTGLYALRDVDLFNLLVIPITSQLGSLEANSVIQAAVAFCEERRAFFIIDADPSKDLTTIATWAAGVSTSRNAAVFFPRIQVADPLEKFRLRDMPASGAVAGVFARTDSQRGVWKAPAGTEATLRGVQGVSSLLTDGENGTINQKGVNALRAFPVYGNVIWGARTTRGDDQQTDEYKYIPVRRLALYIEESLYRGTQWVVFEPNDEPLWAQIRLNLGAFMHSLFRQGAFQGKTPREAYFVKCDKETTTPDDINRGIVNILVGFAPLKPAEFVILKLQQIAGQIAV